MSPKSEEDFITDFFYNIINEKVGYIAYNGIRHYVNKKQIEKFKPTFLSLEEVLQNTKPKFKQKKEETKSGEFLPLALLIPLITGAIAAAGGVTGGVATAVAKSNENKEQARHNAEMERLAKEKAGAGFDNEDSDSEIEEIKYCVNKLRGAGFEFC